MKKPSYKCYERNAELADYLLRTRPKFCRGEAGRKPPNWLEETDGAYTFAHLLTSYWGFDVEYRLCEMLEFSTKHHNKAVRQTNQKELLKIISKDMSEGKTRIFEELGKAVRAVKEAPHDPLRTSITMALHIIESSRKKGELTSAQRALLTKKSVNLGEFFQAGRPTSSQVVAIAEDFFEMSNASERDSVRASLFRTAKKVLRKWASSDLMTW
jgi:hypothetical protein